MSEVDDPGRATARLPGEEGLWSFIAANMVLFALLFGSFLSQRAAAPTLFARRGPCWCRMQRLPLKPGHNGKWRRYYRRRCGRPAMHVPAESCSSHRRAEV